MIKEMVLAMAAVLSQTALIGFSTINTPLALNAPRLGSYQEITNLSGPVFEYALGQVLANNRGLSKKDLIRT
jgi:hypothetical protein